VSQFEKMTLYLKLPAGTLPIAVTTSIVSWNSHVMPPHVVVQQPEPLL
jgi:hypothetical protein